MFVLVLQQLFAEAFLDFIYFPFWWYTKGAKRAAILCLNLLNYGNLKLAPGLWLRNIFVPMYGQYDWQGRIVSFFIRLVQVIIRAAALVFWASVCFALFLVWVSIPAAVIYGFAVYNF
ncbi:MAG: hypothetical protein PHY40_03245 [Patescibacteria group bacterium]|nr:hypothetical protein [Patescibacteria group bacterium]